MDDTGKQHFNDNFKPFRRGDPTPRPGTGGPLHRTGIGSPLVEIVRTGQTADETVGIMFQALKKLGEGPVIARNRSQDLSPFV